MPPAQRASVLIVDDEASIRESLRMILEFEGYRVEEAGDGLAALRIVRDRPPDAILLDIRMPEMDGLETLRTLRERGYDMPVLVISGHADVPTAVEATRRGAFDFFEKPLQRERVLLVAAQRRRGRAAAQGEPPDERRGGRWLRPGRLLAGDAAAARDDRARGADARHGADHRRERHRQGAGGARASTSSRRAAASRSCR